MPGGGVDVIIPVYNAPELTRRCIESLLTHARVHVREILAWDDASAAPTARMLDEFHVDGLRVEHAPRNQGFLASVNRAFGSTRAELVLVLNSDTEARSDFLGPLVAALEADPQLAAVAPASAPVAELAPYRRRGECVVTYQLAGHAFLMRRRAWEQAGGFDPRFGRGYYEDADLSRRLVAGGWWLGVHPGSQLRHEKHGSFSEVPDLRELMHANRALYYRLHPSAARQVALLSARATFPELPGELREEALSVLRGGGEIAWLAPGRPRELPALQVEALRPSLWQGLALRRRGAHRAEKAIKELWIAEGAAPRHVALLRAMLAGRTLALRRF